MFIKRSQAQIVSIIDEEELTEEQKKVAKDLAKQIKKPQTTLPKEEKSEK